MKDEGRLDEAKKLSSDWARFVSVRPRSSRRQRSTLSKILERLERMSERMLTVASWHELLNTP